MKNCLKLLIQKHFKSQCFLSDIDKYLAEIRQKGLHNTPGYEAKQLYYQDLVKKRGQ
jgi:hypothetical protein